MSVFDPNKISPRRDWVSVLVDQRKTKLASGLYLPGDETGVEKVTEGTGTIVRVGPGEKNYALQIFSGKRIVYRGFLKVANDIPTEETWPDGSPKKFFMMSSDDIIGVIEDPTCEVGVFSGRPAVPGV